MFECFWRLLGEIQAGTIKQVYLSPQPWLVAAAGRDAGAILGNAVVAAATYGLGSAFVTIHLHWTTAAVLPAVAMMIAAIAVSLIIAGATLVYKRIQILKDGVLMLVMISSASALPLIQVPGW